MSCFSNSIRCGCLRILPILVSMYVGLVLVAQPAVAQVQPGVLQPAAHTANINGVVTQSNGNPVPGASVRLVGPSVSSTRTDAHGIFVFATVPYGSYQIVIESSFGTAERNILLNGDINVAVQYAAPSALRTIAHVSTASAGAHINVTPASIYSINPSDYAFQGNQSWKNLLNEVPGVTVGGDLISGSSTVGVIPGSPFQPIVLSINGALPYETAISLDGMPLVNTTFFGFGQAGGGTDLSFLPMPMFATADVVRGPGADSPSIVDSIGGSLVLHPPGEVQKNQFDFSVSNDPYGGIFSNAKAALRIGRLSATLYYGFNDSPGPLGSESVVSPAETPATVDGQAFAGCPGPHGCAGEVQTVPPYQNCYCIYSASLLEGGAPVRTSWNSHNGAVDLSYAITPSITAEVFYAGSTSKAYDNSALWPVTFNPGAGYTGSIAPGWHELIQADAPDPISSAASLVEEKVVAYVGSGVLRVAALQNNSYTTQNAPYFMPNGVYTLYGTGYYASAPTTPVNFNGTPALLTFPKFVYSNATQVNNRDLMASYAVQLGPSVSVGASYVSSYYNNLLSISEAQSFFSLTFGLPSPTSETTREFRLFASADVSDTLSLEASWYIADGLYHVPNPATYSSLAPPSSWVNESFPYNAPRVGASWRASQDIVVRAAAGSGYALPQLLYLTGSTSAPTCVTGYCTESATNFNLVPEAAFGLDLGTDVRLQQQTVVSLDLYDTNLHNQFFSSTSIVPCSTCSGRPLYLTEVRNLAHSQFEGVNLNVNHDSSRGVYWRAGLALTRGYVVSVPQGFYNTATCTYCTNTYIIPGINYDGAFQSTVPYASASALVGYRWAPGRYIDLAPVYFGNNNAYYQPAFIALDAHAGYEFTRGLSLIVRFANLMGAHDQDFLVETPSLGAPTVGGQLLDPLLGLPYGPRAVEVTLASSL